MRPPPTPLLLKNARLLDPSRDRDIPGSVLIHNGAIQSVGPPLSTSEAPEGAEIIDCAGHFVAPGLVDIGAAIGEPGAEHRETFATASQAAAAGGVTTVVCLPETNPPIDEPAVVDFARRRARDTALVRIEVMAALTKGLSGLEMAEIGLLKEAGAVAFTDGGRSIMNAGLFRRLLTYAHDFEALVVHHTEDKNLVGDGVMNEGEFASRLGLTGIPVEAEAILLERDMRLVALTGARYHAASITCRASLDILARAKDAGLPVTASTSINHLALNENDVGAFKTFCKMSPPLRQEEDRAALVEAVQTGLIDCINSGHNPQDAETKRQPFAECADGVIGLETMLAAGLRLVHSGALSLSAFWRAASTNPAARLNLQGGHLQALAPADLVVFDPDDPFVLDPALLHSRCKNTPFDGARMQGKVLATLVAGKVVYRGMAQPKETRHSRPGS